MRPAFGEIKCFMKAKCKEEQNHASCLQPSSFQVPSSLRGVLPKAENTVWRMCCIIFFLLKQRKILFLLDKNGQSCVSADSFLRPQGWKRRYKWGRWVDTLCVGGCSESTHSSCSPSDYPFLLSSSFSSWLYQGHYFRFINLCASSPVFLSLVLIYHTKTYAIVRDLYVECPDIYSQKYFCLTDLPEQI